MHPTLVLNVVGLTPSLLGPNTPHLNTLSSRGAIVPTLPAVTCSVQSTYLTGLSPQQHGIVGNGWLYRDTREVRFWQQAGSLVTGKRVWDVARERDKNFTVANIGWWFAMGAGTDFTVTPRPQYPADGRKLQDCWTDPPSLRDTLQNALGPFPLFRFWGPMADITSTRWLADAAIKIDQLHKPTLTLVYLPHLDYNLQRLGPDDVRIVDDVRAVDEQVGRLLAHFKHHRVLVVSEYGISAVHRPVHLNRVLRQAGLIRVRDEADGEVPDPGHSPAFAVADHQLAHIYIEDTARLNDVRQMIDTTPGVARTYVGEERQQIGLDHPRSGEIIALAEPDAWFTWYTWLDDDRAPRWANMVDIHRKPGYDPVELFSRVGMPAVAWRLAKRKLGLRTLLDVTPLDATLVKGSHGLLPLSPETSPIAMSNAVKLPASMNATAVHDLMLRHLFE